MSGEILGSATLELDADLAPLDASLDKAEARVAAKVAVMQALLDSLHAPDLNIGVSGGALPAGAAPVAGTAAARAVASAPAAAAQARGATQNEIQRGGTWGVRGPEQAGTIRNPIVTVLEASKYTPMGSYAAGVGSSDATDMQRAGGSGLADAASIEALRNQMADLADNISSASRLASQGQQGLLTPAQQVGMPQTTPTSADTANAVALQQAADALSKIQGDLTSSERRAITTPHASPTASASRSMLMPSGASSTSTSSSNATETRLTQALLNEAQAEARSNTARSAYARTVRTTSTASPQAQAAALAQRQAALEELTAARAETKAAQKEMEARAGSGATDFAGSGSSSGAGKGGSGPSVAAGGGGQRGGGGGGRHTWTPWGGSRFEPDGPSPFSAGNLLKGDGGRGGAFGLPGFGSIGSLAGLGLEHWILSALGIGASATAAVGGAGLLGTASLAKSAVGGGSDALVGKATQGQIQATTQDWYALQTAIAEYGKGSTQATHAQNLLNYSIQQMGGGAAQQAELQVYKNVKALKDLFNEDSNAARAESAQGMDQIVKLGTVYTPLVTAAAARNLAIINTGLKPLFTWLEGPDGIAIFQDLENSFARDLPTSIHAFDMGIEDFLRLMDVASQYTGGLSRDLDKIFTDKNRESTAQYQAEVQKLVGDLREWEQLLKVLGEDARGVFKQDAGTANSIVGELTQMLEKLHAWENSTSGQTQLQNIFYVHKQEILQLLHLLSPLGSAYGKFYMDVAPPLVTALTDIAGAIDKVLTAVEKIPGGGFLVGLTLVLGKLGILSHLGPGLVATARAMGLISAAEGAGGAVAGAGAAAAGAGAAEGVGGGAAAGGVAGLLAKIGSSGASDVGAGLTAEGIAAAASAALPLLIAGGGLAAVAIAFQKIAGQPGGTATATSRGTTGVDNSRPSEPGNGRFGAVGPGSTPSSSGLHSQTLDIKKVGDFAGYSTTRLRELIGEIKQAGAIKVNGISETKNEVLGLANAALTAKDKFNSGFNQAWRAVDLFYRNSSRSLSSLKDDFASNMRLIVQTVGTGSEAGRKLMAENVEKMVLAVVDGMSTGKISAAHGMAEINAALAQGMQTGAISWTQAWQTRFNAVTDLYAANKIDTQQYTAGIRSILNDGDQRIKADNKASLAQQLAQLQSAHQKGLLTTEQYTAKVHDITAQMTVQSKTDMGLFAATIVGGFATVTAQSGKGLQDLIKSVNSALGLLGQAPLTGLQVAVLTGNQGHNSAATAGSTLGHNHAAGGLIQVGREGEKGRDTVPLNVAGKPIKVGAGEKVAVFNDDQQRVMNHRLSDYGGLNGFFSKVNRPHFMASGGFVPGFAGGGSLSYGQLEGLWEAADGPKGVAPIAAAIAEAESGGRDVMQQGQPFATTGWGYWQITPGGPQYLDPMTNARMAVSDYRGRGFEPWTTYNDGAYRQFLQGDVPASAGGIGGGAGALQQILAPRVKGSGPLGKMTQAAMSIVAKAANSFLSSKAPAGGMGAGGGAAIPGGGASSGPPGLATFEGVTMAKWIANELEWATQHGWHGQPTSGYRPGYDPHAPGGSEHALINYPGGAVDFGGMTGDPAAYATKLALVELAARLDYPGPRLMMPIGFQDDGHLSGDGHAKGGWVTTGATVDDFSGGPMQTGLPTSYNGGMTFAELLMTPPRHPNLGQLLGLGAGTLPSAFGIDVRYGGREVDDIRRIDTGDGQPSPFYSVDLETAAANRLGFPGKGSIQVRAHEAMKAATKGKAKKSTKKTKPPHLVGVQGGMGGAHLAGSDADIKNINQQIANLSGMADQSGAGEFARLGDLLNYWPQMWSLNNPLLGQDASAFIVTQDADGNAIKPSVDQSGLSLTQGEEGQELGWWQLSIEEIRDAVKLSMRLVPEIKKAIKKRQDEVAKLKAHIEANLRKMATLREEITDIGDDPNVTKLRQEINTAEAGSSTLTSLQQQLASAEAIKVPSGKAGDAKRTAKNSLVASLREKIYAKQHGKKVTVADLRNDLLTVEQADKTSKIGWEAKITGLEATNQTLGGDKTAVGTAGQIGPLNSKISALQTALGQVTGSGSFSALSLQGPGGIGGILGPDLIQQATLQQQIAQTGPGPIGAAKAVADAAWASSGSGGGTDQSALLSLEQQLNTQLAEQLAVSQRQYAVLQQLPPFGGSFLTGGVIPGPVGAARIIEAHGGEIVTSVADQRAGGTTQPHVHVNFNGDTAWLKKFVNVEIQHTNRQTGRRVSRGLPSRGGGSLTPR